MCIRDSAGCTGACRRKGLLLRMFGCAVVLGMVALGAGATVMWTTDRALEAARAANYNASAMASDYAYTWRNIYHEFAALYRFCAPVNASSVWAPLAAGRAPTADVVVQCGESLLDAFDEWAND
eukprot:3016191-Prymnesium_polylepis.1